MYDIWIRTAGREYECTNVGDYDEAVRQVETLQNSDSPWITLNNTISIKASAIESYEIREHKT